ncbi:MAG: SpoIIE family protein phosphatase [Chloroflexota bacterium]
MKDPAQIFETTPNSSNAQFDTSPTVSQVATFTRSLRAVFHGLDVDIVKELTTFGTLKTYQPGDIIIQQGLVGDTFYVLLEGRVAITQKSIGEEEITLGVVTPGKYFGEMGLLEDVSRTATCIAMTEVKALEVGQTSFEEIMETRPKLAYSVMFHVLSNLRRNESNALNSLVKKAEELEVANRKLQNAQEELIAAERFKREIEIAGEVQRSLLPKELPEHDGIEFSAWLAATRAGGDFYDVIDLDDENIGVLLGDVGNQGIQASLYMTMVRTLFRTECRRSLSPKEVAMAVHNGIMDVTTVSDMYVNAFYGVLHKPSGMFTYIIAGQEQPFLHRPGQGIAQLKGRGNFLGLAQTINLPEKRMRTRPGDQLILVSDGIYGAINDNGDVFGQDTLIELIKASKNESAKELTTNISSALESWTSSTNPYDHNDLALLVMKILHQ